MGVLRLGLYMLLISMPCVQNREDDYFTSPAAIQKLMTVEQHFLSAFKEYVNVLEKRIEKVKRYLEDYEESVGTGMRKADDPITSKVKLFDNAKDLRELSIKVSSHPLMTYRLIRRFVVELQDLEKDVGNQNEKKLLGAMEKIRKGIRLPQRRDVQGSIEGLLRAQDTYDLNITDFTRGNFQGLETRSSLTAMDCYQVGVYAFQAQIHTRAIEWLQRAYRLTTQENDTTIANDTILRDLEDAVLQHDETQERDPDNIYVYRQPIGDVERLVAHSIETESHRLEKVADHRVHILYKEQENIMDLFNFAALCSGKPLQPPRKRKLLTCVYKHSQMIPILAEKIEFLHLNPDVYQIYDVLNESEMERVIEVATPSMVRAKVQSMITGETYSTDRTSTSTWIIEDTDKVLMKIPRRIQMVTGLNTLSPSSAEDLQVSSYGIGGHYNPHFDLLFEDYVPEPEDQLMGDRIATFMFYLSDVKRGGGTAFPRLGILAQPIKGSAIFWFNLRSDGTKDPLSLHGGCPVLYGTKHVANKWIRANAQMLTRKCELEKPDEMP